MIDEPKICENCGKVFQRDIRNTRLYWSKARFCSRLCTGENKTKIANAIRLPMENVFSKWFTCDDVGCWPWQGALDKDGYGIFTYARKSYRAPIISLKLDGRPVQAGQYACHTCDNPPCVRPDHLYPGTPKQNSSDAVARNRARPGKKAKLTENDVLAIRDMDGSNSQIASKFSVSNSLVSMIKRRTIWKNLP
jgi:hypothetical protein